MDQSQPPAASSAADRAAPSDRERPRKGPLSFFSGAVTSALLCWLCLQLSRRVVLHFALHPPAYSSRLAQSIATAIKTLAVGMSFLATFSFGFIALGLTLVLVRSLAGPAAKSGQSP